MLSCCKSIYSKRRISNPFYRGGSRKRDFFRTGHGLRPASRNPRFSAISAWMASILGCVQKCRFVPLFWPKIPISCLSAIARAFVQVFTSSSAGSVRRKAFPVSNVSDFVLLIYDSASALIARLKGSAKKTVTSVPRCSTEATIFRFFDSTFVQGRSYGRADKFPHPLQLDSPTSLAPGTTIQFHCKKTFALRFATSRSALQNWTPLRCVQKSCTSHQRQYR